MTTRAAVVVWTLTLAAAVGVSAAVLTSGHATGRWWTVALAIPTGLAFVASGIVARKRRPDNRTGLLLIAVGLASFVGALAAADDDALYTLGSALQWVYFGFLVHVVLAFPSGRLATSTSRTVVAAAYALGVACCRC